MSDDLPRKTGDTSPKLEREPSRLAVDWTDDKQLDLGMSGKWSWFFAAAQNASVVEGLVGQLALIGSEGRKGDANATDFAVGFVDAMDPRDPAEVLSQMAVTHQAVMMLAKHLNHTKTIPQKDCAEKAHNKTARTFASQMETFKRYRSKGQQVVRVKRVTVESWGQAIVGDVQAGGGADMKADGNPMQSAHDSPRCHATSKRSGTRCRAPAVLDLARRTQIGDMGAEHEFLRRCVPRSRRWASRPAICAACLPIAAEPAEITRCTALKKVDIKVDTKILKQKSPKGFKTLGAFDGAQKRTRTSTALRPLAPEASASTNSAIWARNCVKPRFRRAGGACQR